jgi:class 3 adenylate cyclase
MNTTARLCSVAQSGQIILSEATFKKVQGQIAAVPLPPVRLKGKADELRIYNAVGTRDRRSPGENTRPA